MKVSLIFSVLLFLFSCRDSKSQSSGNYQVKDFLNAQNYLEEFTLFNDWFLTTTFCKRKDNGNMDFSADIYFKYSDALKWKKNKHWYKNEDYIVNVENRDMMDLSSKELHDKFEMWAIVTSESFFKNYKETDNACFDVKDGVTYEIYHSNISSEKWDLVKKTQSKSEIKKIIDKESLMLDRKYSNKKDTSEVLNLKNITNVDLKSIEGTFKVSCNEDIYDPLLYNFSELSSYIDLFNKEDIEARVIVDTYKNSEEKENFYFKYSQLAGITRHNRNLEWSILSKDSIVAKIKVINRNELKLWWYGFYDTKQGKWVHRKSDFNILGGENPVTLVRCADN